MSPTRAARRKSSKPVKERRRYHSPLRQQRTGETRERILVAGASLVHSFPINDWSGLTFRAVGERAGVSERTVHRHFPTERRLKDAVIERLMEESGVQLETTELDTFADVATRTFAYVSSFGASPEVVTDPSMAAVDQRRRDAVMGAVVRATPGWSQREREMAAAMLDMLWNIPPYERLLTAWRLEPKRAIAAVTWVIGMIQRAIRQNERPG